MAKKDAILERSSQIFFKFGLSKISMDELADQIGISKKTIYNNFGSKENLMEEIIYSSMEGILTDISNIFTSRNKTIIEKIHLAIRHLYKHYTNFENPTKVDPNAARIIFSPKCLFLNGQIQQVIEDLATAAQKSGIIKQSIHVGMIPYVFLNSIRGLATWERPEIVGFSKIELLKYSIDIILDGILTPEAMEEYLKSN
ncbi:TetR/AcrR family transcriptional regulator [Thiospirochaeta perfilievii]|uniref:TetR/AcrR family transcriptional regulator n=1 Tax=Thiospirochaeta perfilievii TaxID=252967 RepID=A0A5C1QC15_9SPIO|nr:TetR/AcrR family transcriptional regulator [Thiospirochaeta perfilievii]QEN04439.1 TetR/AcrR family transcriptional regulator [Thiospirochaeta perfilievii]